MADNTPPDPLPVMLPAGNRTTEGHVTDVDVHLRPNSVCREMTYFYQSNGGWVCWERPHHVDWNHYHELADSGDDGIAAHGASLEQRRARLCRLSCPPVSPEIAAKAKYVAASYTMIGNGSAEVTYLPGDMTEQWIASPPDPIIPPSSDEPGIFPPARSVHVPACSFCSEPLSQWDGGTEATEHASCRSQRERREAADGSEMYLCFDCSTPVTKQNIRRFGAAHLCVYCNERSLGALRDGAFGAGIAHLKGLKP